MGSQGVAITRGMACSPCYLARAIDCHRGLACLHRLRVGDVFRMCRRMLTLSWHSVVPAGEAIEPPPDAPAGRRAKPARDKAAKPSRTARRRIPVPAG
jgi:hypothetical protein